MDRRMELNGQEKSAVSLIFSYPFKSRRMDLNGQEKNAVSLMYLAKK